MSDGTVNFFSRTKPAGKKMNLKLSQKLFYSFTQIKESKDGECDDMKIALEIFSTQSILEEKQKQILTSSDFLTEARNARAYKLLSLEYAGYSKILLSNDKLSNVEKAFITEEHKKEIPLNKKQFEECLDYIKKNQNDESGFLNQIMFFLEQNNLIKQKVKIKQQKQETKDITEEESKTNEEDEDGQVEKSNQEQSQNKIDEIDENEKLKNQEDRKKSNSKNLEGKIQKPQITKNGHEISDFHYNIIDKSFDYSGKIETYLKENGIDIKKFRDSWEKQFSVAKVSDTLRSAILNLIFKIQSTKQKTTYSNLTNGFLDRKKLTKILTSQSLQKPIFKKTFTESKKELAITILIDNSGSMRGNLIFESASITTILGNILSLFNIPFEVIGYTTKSWNGGEVAKNIKDTQISGRACEVLHLIYKTFNCPWRSSKKNIGIMCQNHDLLKENIDGEAILFASRRLSSREEKEKLIIVISDGVPVDEATISLNGKDYLQKHLLQVLAREQKNIKIFGVGIGYDVSRFYKNNIRLERSEADKATKIIEKISDFI